MRKELDERFKEDLEFVEKTDLALKKYEKGEFKEKKAKEFLKDLETW